MKELKNLVFIAVIICVLNCLTCTFAITQDEGAILLSREKIIEYYKEYQSNRDEIKEEIFTNPLLEYGTDLTRVYLDTFDFITAISAYIPDEKKQDAEDPLTIVYRTVLNFQNGELDLQEDTPVFFENCDKILSIVATNPDLPLELIQEIEKDSGL